MLETIHGHIIEFVFDEECEPDYMSRTWTVGFVKTPRGRRKQIAQITEDFDSKGNKIERVSFSYDDKATAKERSKIKNRLIKFGCLHQSITSLFRVHERISSFCAEFK